jgi:hypothetical protein
LDDRSLNSDRNPDAVANRGFWVGIALDRLERIGELQAKLNTAVLAREQAERERDEARAEVTLLKSVVAELDAGEADRPEIEAENEQLRATIRLLTEELNSKTDEVVRFLAEVRQAQGRVDAQPGYRVPEPTPEPLGSDPALVPDPEPEPSEPSPTAGLLTVLDGRISAVDRRVDVVRDDLLHLLGQAESVAQLQAEAVLIQADVAAIQAEVAAIRDETEPPLPSPEQLQRVIHDQRVDLMTRRIDDVVQHVEEMAGQVTRLSSRFNLLNQGVTSPVRVTEPIPLPSNAGDYEADPNILNARVNNLQEKLAAMELQLSSVLGKTKLASKAAFADYTHFQEQLDETRQLVQETAKTIAFYWGNPLGPEALDAIRGEVKVVADSINHIRNQCGAMGVIQADIANRLADLEAPNPVLETVASEIRELKSQFESLFKGSRISFEQQDQRLTRLEEQKVTWDETKRALGMLPLISEKTVKNTSRIDELAIRLGRRLDTLKRRVRRIAAQLPKVVPAPAAAPEPAKKNGKPVKAASPAVPKPVGKVKTGKVKAWNKTTKPK